jgi:hypothetical protein
MPDLRRTRRRVALAAILSLLALAGAVAAPADASSDSVPPRRAPSLRDSPGWYPVVDPESASVRLGRRANAPRVGKPFHGGVRSLDELGLAVCRGLHHSDRDSLLALCVRADEFRDILWREFPQSRPITGLTWEDGWMSLEQRLRSGVSGALNVHGGQHWRFVRFESDSAARFKNFRLHMGLRLFAVDDRGRTVPMAWVRAVAERGGRFKIYSTDD